MIALVVVAVSFATTIQQVFPYYCVANLSFSRLSANSETSSCGYSSPSIWAKWCTRIFNRSAFTRQFHGYYTFLHRWGAAASVTGSSRRAIWISQARENCFSSSVGLIPMFEWQLNLMFRLHCIAACLIDGTSALGASYAGCNAHLVGQMFAVSIAMQGLLTSSLYVIPTDLSPNYAGTISAMMYSIACITSIFSPIIIGYLAPNVSNAFEWFRRMHAIIHF